MYRLESLKPEYKNTVFNSKEGLHKCISLSEDVLASTCEHIMEPLHSRLFQEILSIEKEKLVLRNPKSRLNKIFEQEIIQCAKRDILLKDGINYIKQEQLYLNPAIEIYESDWRWIVRESEAKRFDISELIETPPGNYYFLFEKCGTFDECTDTNVFETPLTQLQYLFLRLFEEENQVAEVLKKFYSVFEVDTPSEQAELDIQTEKILNMCIYRRFLITNETRYVS
ncbi:hypothetical protein [Ascidiimonas aurantiaca]|uniref:hypothetical protein n=1 Tax=Ascidiimonas aurantiaca TaxID=1685432 RepID=UPI0030EB5AAC